MPPLPKSLLPVEDQAAQAVEERLRLVASRFEPVIRGRVSTLLMAAADAILQLSDMDLVRHESDEEIGHHTLAVWEELAPVMVATVESVNRMVVTAQKAFPPPPEKDVSDNLDDAFGPSTGKEILDAEEVMGTDVEIARLLAAVASGMRRDVARLGERLRTPSVVADPWNLVSDLLEFRGRLRAGIGELLYQVCLNVEELERIDVVPGYAADLEGGLLLRQASTNLAFLFRGHTKRIGASSDERIVAALQDALKDLHAFSRTRALPALRTSDKRIFLETRAQLYQLVKASPVQAREIKLAMENLARFLDSLSVVSRRENLRIHDRAQLAAAGRALEAAQSSVGDPATARGQLTAALRSAQVLYGRDLQLDAYLRAQRHFPVDWLTDAEVLGEIQRVGSLLAGITTP